MFSQEHPRAPANTELWSEENLLLLHLIFPPTSRSFPRLLCLSPFLFPLFYSLRYVSFHPFFLRPVVPILIHPFFISLMISSPLSLSPLRIFFIFHFLIPTHFHLCFLLPFPFFSLLSFSSIFSQSVLTCYSIGLIPMFPYPFLPFLSLFSLMPFSLISSFCFLPYLLSILFF